jgi:uncharacterized protein YutE (UPF0331/DUF86 family)
MVDEERFQSRLARVEEDLGALRRFGGIDAARLADDLELRWAAERGLQVVIEGLLEIGAHVLASEFGLQSFGYRDIAERMVEKGIVTVEGFPRIASFRNVLVHEYVRMDLEILAAVLSTGLDELVRCASDLRRRAWIEMGSDPGT